MTRLKLQDNKYFQFGDMTEETEDIFTVDLRALDRPFEFSGTRTHLALNYERDMDLYV